MKKRHHFPKLRLGKRTRPWLRWLGILGIAASAVIYWMFFTGGPAALYAPGYTPAYAPSARPGDVMGIDKVENFSPSQTADLIKQNYGPTAEHPNVGLTKVTFHYRSELPGGKFITNYARAYLPTGATGKLPIFGFAPGTTGIGDECSPSLENVKAANWGNYDSHMAMYASHGYAAVTTDYEGQRDPSRIHHYMVGELEGRAVLDSVRALTHLPEAAGNVQPGQVFLAGYSQGGHAAFWADRIASAYAPDLKVRGVVGFGPVMSVEQTLADVTRGANINWFGPYVLYSYSDYYKINYDIPSILQPYPAEHLTADVPAHCIDTDIQHWGRNPAAVYTPDFLNALTTGTLSERYSALLHDLEANDATGAETTSAKRINAGELDNVVLPAQQQAALPKLCASSRGPVQLGIYPHTTHYDTMLHSLADTLNWMAAVRKGQAVPGNCSGAVTATPTLTPTPTPSPTPQFTPSAPPVAPQP
jgi:hypothetical protein